MNKLDYLEQAVLVHKTAYGFCKHHKIEQTIISKLRKEKIPYSKIVAEAIATDITSNIDEQNKIVGFLIR